MIPKIIHYCWFGKGKMAPELEMCLDSWRKYCPDYEIKRWDEDNSPMDVPWVHDAYKHQKYAFVADYMRFYALYHEGGIYMDTDMLLVRSLDNFLSDKAFLGRESAQFASMGIIGAEKGNDFTKLVLDQYNATKFNFVKPPVIPRFITPYLKQYGFTEEDTTQHLSNGWVVYKTDYFYPIPRKQDFLLENILQYAEPDTCGIHLWNKSWSDEIDILRKGNIREGLKLVWVRFKRTPILPAKYWFRVLKACFSSTWLGRTYHKHLKKID